MDELGAGFYSYMTSNPRRRRVLGESQSGEMQEVGFNLFTEMLNRAVAALKQGKEPDLLQPLGIATEINLHTPALLPNDYAPDVHERLTLYKRLANCDSLVPPTCQINGLKPYLQSIFFHLPQYADLLRVGLEVWPDVMMERDHHFRIQRFRHAQHVGLVILSVIQRGTIP